MEEVSLEGDHVAPRPATEKQACGCEAGAIAASAALLGYFAYLFAAEGAPPGWQLSDLGWGSAVVFGAALAGKAVGIVRARRAVNGA
jgi:hypothetical protein